MSTDSFISIDETWDSTVRNASKDRDLGRGERIPYEDFQKMLATARSAEDVALADRDSAGKMTTYGTIMSGILGFLGADNTCACAYTPGRCRSEVHTERHRTTTRS